MSVFHMTNPPDLPGDMEPDEDEHCVLCRWYAREYPRLEAERDMLRLQVAEMSNPTTSTDIGF